MFGPQLSWVLAALPTTLPSMFGGSVRLDLGSMIGVVLFDFWDPF
jgi:hypothetical protein